MHNVFSKIKATIAAGSALAFSALPALADITHPTNLPASPTAFFEAVLNGLTAVAGTIALVFLLIGGIRYVMSGGDKTGVEEARNQITGAIVGLLIVFGAWFIVTVIGSFFTGLTILTLPGAK